MRVSESTRFKICTWITYLRVACVHACILRDAFTRELRGGRRMRWSYRKSQIPLTSLASYQGKATLRCAPFGADFFAGPTAIYFFLTCDEYVYAIGTRARRLYALKMSEVCAERYNLATVYGYVLYWNNYLISLCDSTCAFQLG